LKRFPAGLIGRPWSVDSPGPCGVGPCWLAFPGPLGTSSDHGAPTKGTTVFTKSVYVFGTEDFREETADTLRSLMETATGKAVVGDIQASGKTVLIVERLVKTNGWIAKAEAKSEKDARSQDPLPHWKHADGTLRSGSPASWIPDKPGPGSDTIIQFNLHFADPFSPGELILGHELIHARRNARGYQLVGTDGLGQSLEERAVEGPWDPVEPMTGNALRVDLNKRGGGRHLGMKKIFRDDGY
jgi:hypothetical protein